MRGGRRRPRGAGVECDADVAHPAREHGVRWRWELVLIVVVVCPWLLEQLTMSKAHASATSVARSSIPPRYLLVLFPSYLSRFHDFPCFWLRTSTGCCRWRLVLRLLEGHLDLLLPLRPLLHLLLDLVCGLWLKAESEPSVSFVDRGSQNQPCRRLPHLSSSYPSS